MQPLTFAEFEANAKADGFDEALERDMPHSERYGSEGATYWVARRAGKTPPPENY